MKRLIIIGLLVVAIVGLGFYLYNVSNQPLPADIVSREGVHWHPKLTIYIQGQKQEISSGIGIGTQHSNNPDYDPMMGMTNVHTHDTSGTLHWENMMGPVRKDQTKLAVFFKNWNKQFNSSCILDSCNGSDGMVTMTVNGSDNTQFDNYEVKDGDDIVIRY